MSTSSEQQSEKNAQNKTISGLTEQLNTLTSSIKLLGKDLVGSGEGAISDLGKTVGKTASIAVDATLDEIPGGKVIAGMVGDAKKYFTGLKERAKAETEKKDSQNDSKDEKSRHDESKDEKSRHDESKDSTCEVEKPSHNESKEFIREVEKSGHDESKDTPKDDMGKPEKPNRNESKDTTKELVSELEKSKDANSADNKEIVDAIKETTEAIKESNDIAKKAATEEKIKSIKDKDVTTPSQLVKHDDKNKKDEKSGFGMFGALGATIMGSIFSIIKNAGAFLTAGLAVIGKNIMKGLGAALRFAGRALFFAVRLLNPIGWALLIADLLVTFKEEIIGFFKGDGFKNFIKSTKQLLIDAWNGIVKFFTDTDWSGLMQSASEGIGNFISTIGTWFKDSMVSLWDGVKNWVSDLTEVISVIGSAIYDELLKPLGNWVLDSVKSMWDSVTNKISGWVTDFEVLVSDKWTSAKQFLNDIPNKLMEPFDILIDWFKSFSLGGKLNDLLSGVTDKIMEGFASIYNITVAKLPGVDTKMLPNGKLVKSDDYAEYEKLVNAGNSAQLAAAKITQSISDREAAEHQDNVKKVMAEQHVSADEAEKIVVQQEKEKNQGIIGKAVSVVGDAASAVGSAVADGASAVYNKGASAVKAFFGRSSSDGKYKIISDKGKITGIKAKGKFDASSDTMKSLLATSTGKDNSIPTGAAGDNIKNNLERVAEQLWDPVKQLDPGAKISSGFRSTEVNQHIDGATMSDHTEGRAIDIMPGPGQTPTSLANAIIANNLPFNKLIVEPSWVHLSIPKEGETAQRLVMIANTAMEGSEKAGKYGPVKVEDINLTDAVPPGGNISRNEAKELTANKKSSAPLSSNISSPPIATGDTIATGAASVSNAKDEFDVAKTKATSDAMQNTLVTANSGNTTGTFVTVNNYANKSNVR